MFTEFKIAGNAAFKEFDFFNSLRLKFQSGKSRAEITAYSW